MDPQASIIEWAGRNPNTKHHGLLRLHDGSLKVTQGRISGKVGVDMTSIENLSLKGDDLYPVLIDHLKSDDFCFVASFPRARFKVSNADPATQTTLGRPNYTVRGELNLRGVQADLEFEAHLGLRENGGLWAQAHFDLDRTRWRVICGSSRFFKNLGMHLV